MIPQLLWHSTIFIFNPVPHANSGMDKNTAELGSSFIRQHEMLLQFPCVRVLATAPTSPDKGGEGPASSQQMFCRSQTTAKVQGQC